MNDQQLNVNDIGSSMDNRARKASFDKLGFVFCAQFQTKQQIADINDNLARVFQTVVPKMAVEHVFYEDVSRRGTLKQLQLLHQYDDYFNKLMTESPFRVLAEELLEQQVVCRNMQYFNKPPGIGMPTPAHQDGYYFKLEPANALTMWLALEPVDEENGCVRYVPGSHELGMRPHGKTGTLGFSQGITDFPNENDLADEVAFPADPGDLLVHHALTIHRAESNDSLTRSRQALGFIYYGADAKLDEERWQQYQSELQSTLDAKHNDTDS